MAQACRRLVEQKDGGLPRQRTRNFNDPLLTQRQRAGQGVRVCTLAATLDLAASVSQQRGLFLAV